MPTDSPSINISVPMQLHPDMLLPDAKVLDVDNTTGQKALHAAREALGVAYDAYSRLEQAQRELQRTGPKHPGRNANDPASVAGEVWVGGEKYWLHGGEVEFHAAADALVQRTQ